MKKLSVPLLAVGLLALAACEDPYNPTLRPDYVIHVAPSAQGDVAVPPPCPDYTTYSADPFDNQPMPQFGCASARNLAAMVENPDDLVQGRNLGPTRGVHSVGEVRRYDNDQTRGLIVPGAEVNQQATTTSSTATSALSGDVTGGAGSSSSSSSSSSATTAATSALATP